jgi:hypothetical protein
VFGDCLWLDGAVAQIELTPIGYKTSALVFEIPRPVIGCFVYFIVYSYFSAIWQLSTLTVTELQIYNYQICAFSSESSFTYHTCCDMGP